MVALSSMGASRTSGLGMITALSLLAGGFFENFLCGLHLAQNMNRHGLRTPIGGQS